MLRAENYKGGQFCRQASSLPNALFYLGLFVKQLPVMRWRCVLSIWWQIVFVNVISCELREIA